MPPPTKRSLYPGTLFQLYHVAACKMMTPLPLSAKAVRAFWNNASPKSLRFAERTRTSVSGKSRAASSASATPRTSMRLVARRVSPSCPKKNFSKSWEPPDPASSTRSCPGFFGANAALGGAISAVGGSSSRVIAAVVGTTVLSWLRKIML